MSHVIAFSSIDDVNRAMRDHLTDTLNFVGAKEAKRKVDTIPFPINMLNVMRVNQQHIRRETGGFVYLRTGQKNKASSVPKAILQTHVGTLDEVTLINLMNLEIDWHTHVEYSDGRKMSPPSPEDYISCLLCHDFFGAQISLVITNEGLYVMWPTAALVEQYMTDTDVVAESFDEFSQGLVEDFFGDRAFKQGDLSQYYKRVWKFGFRVYLVSWNDIQNASRNTPGGASGINFSFLASRKPVD